MLKKIAISGLLSVFVFLSFATAPVLAQGVPGQDYSGLDKYLGQGRQDNSSFAGVRAAEFLTIPIGARGIAMGSAFAAVADDITSIWWNPAGLGFLEQKEVMLTVVDYTMDLTYSYAAFATPLGDSKVVVGGFFGYLDVPETEITTVTSPQGTGSYYSAYDYQMGGSLAYTFSDRFIGGINMKYVHQDMYDNIGGSAFAIDAGGIYYSELYNRRIKLAFSIQNLGTNIAMRGPNLLHEVGAEDRSGEYPSGYENYSNSAESLPGENLATYSISARNTRQMYVRTHTYRLPTVVKLSLAYSLLTSESTNWLASGEIWRNNNMPISYATGTELTYGFNPSISASLRAGWHIQTDEYTESADQFGYTYHGDDPTMRGFSIGGGIKRLMGGKFIEFNYAYRNKGRLSADNFFTVTFGF
ncbi:MAG: PorV/PorQ family protein [Candidatus Glassbacteria bacterium]|nr:PorV/PorQ family protein [Candidatus Glassbacteria bacterium]